MFPNVGLLGYAGAGKDTVAEYLVKTHQYTRVSFADPLKEMALEIDPLIMTSDYTEDACELSWLVENFGGWEGAKAKYPGVRTFLRTLGRVMRDRDPDYWLDIALEKIYQARRLNMPVVVTDVRHENEYQRLWECPNRFTMVRIDRPGHDTSDVDPESDALIKSVTPDYVISNHASLRDLHYEIRNLVTKHS